MVVEVVELMMIWQAGLFDSQLAEPAAEFVFSFEVEGVAMIGYDNLILSSGDACFLSVMICDDSEG